MCTFLGIIKEEKCIILTILDINAKLGRHYFYDYPCIMHELSSFDE